MKKTRVIGAVYWLALVGIVAGLYAAFIYAPNEKTMGVVQRIFYFHVPSAWVAFLAFFVVFVGGIMYLRTRERHWDTLALSSAEIGVVFCAIALITGSIWGKATWGTWWTWEPRLTTTLVLWLIYVAYVMLRRMIEEESQRARVAAVFGMVGFVDVPIVFMSIRWWRTMHPLVFTAEEMRIAPPMMVALLIALVAFTLFYVYLMIQRVSIEELGHEVERLKHRFA
ncbi:MAG: cytochrome c biogenesis protein CcsA [Dehalococcoidales bacterium]|nr:cytochrome c biogenesis protein CcsA [Dehalococcoidales bacterium]